MIDTGEQEEDLLEKIKKFIALDEAMDAADEAGLKIQYARD